MGLEKRLNDLKPTEVGSLGRREWYDFLYREYFPWKYTAAKWLATTRAQLRKHVEFGELDTLLTIRDRILASGAKGDLKRSVGAARQIRGLGTAGASGLIALLFPHFFGAVDQFVVKALKGIPVLPEHAALLGMRDQNLSDGDAVLLNEMMRGKASELNALFGTEFLDTPQNRAWFFGAHVAMHHSHHGDVAPVLFLINRPSTIA